MITNDSHNPRLARADTMINSIEIKNFRCFDKLSVPDLGQINVVVGENASGKTALLEAIFLSQMSSPDIVMRLRLWRGLGGEIQLMKNKASYEALWRDLFCRLDQAQPISIRAQGTAENERHVEVFYEPDESVPISLSENGSGPVSDTAAIVPIRFRIKDAHGEEFVLTPEITPTGLSVKAIVSPSSAAFYSSAFMASTHPSEAAKQFSEYSKKGDDNKLTRLIRKVFPSLKSISSEIAGGTWMLHAQVPGIREKLPIGLISSGVQKLISLLMGIVTQERGLVLVDELDNGFHYSTLREVWAVLQRACEMFHVQLFVSTHSKECLEALLPTIKDNEDYFRLIRLTRTRGKSRVRVFEGADFEAAIETDTEIR